VFVVWVAVAMIWYYSYGIRHSHLNDSGVTAKEPRRFRDREQHGRICCVLRWCGPEDATPHAMRVAADPLVDRDALPATCVCGVMVQQELGLRAHRRHANVLNSPVDEEY
jgi:hypothetical protein